MERYSHLDTAFHCGTASALFRKQKVNRRGGLRRLPRARADASTNATGIRRVAMPPHTLPQVRPIAFDRTLQEGLHPLVDLLAQPADLALADAAHAERLHQIIHRARRDAVDVGFLDHGGQCLLGHEARLQEAGEVAAFAQLGDAQFDSAGAGLPITLAVAPALGGASAGRFPTAPTPCSRT